MDFASHHLLTDYSLKTNLKNHEWMDNNNIRLHKYGLKLIHNKMLLFSHTSFVILAQELEHQRGILTNDLQEANNSWISKAFTSLRTSSGGLGSISLPRDGAPAMGWNFHSGSLSGWSTKKILWPHRHNRENI